MSEKSTDFESSGSASEDTQAISHSSEEDELRNSIPVSEMTKSIDIADWDVIKATIIKTLTAEFISDLGETYVANPKTYPALVHGVYLKGYFGKDSISYIVTDMNQFSLPIANAIQESILATSSEVSAEDELTYETLVAALDEAEGAAKRIVSAYDTSLRHLRECRFESEAACAILTHSKRSSDAVAATATRNH